MAAENQAAWQSAKKVASYTVGNAPYTRPNKGEVVIKNGAVGVNPFDWWLQYVAGLFAPHLTYPTILGTDCAGTVVEVGPGVTRFKIGDRVTGNAAAAAKESGLAAEGAFQLYPVLREYLICHTPDGITDEQAAVLGLGFVTAAFGLFSQDYLGLDMPTVPARPNPAPAEKHKRAVIITGGASSLGACAVQLAVAAGYEVISTSSPKNFDFVRGLGAAHVFDYNSKSLVADLVQSLQDRHFDGALTVGDGADEVCVAVIRERLKKTPNLSTRKFVALAGGSRKDPATLEGAFVAVGLMYGMGSMMAKLAVRKMLTGVETKFIMMKEVVNPESCVASVYQNFLGPALASGQFKPAPEALVVGQGLSEIQHALKVQGEGVSARKIVVSLP